MPIYLNHSFTGTAVPGLAKGQVYGMTLGSKPVTPRSVGVAVSGWNYGAQVPHDASSGQTSGKRQHTLLTITKETDVSSPQLLNAKWKSELIPTINLNFLRKRSPQGGEQPYFTITLTNGAIASYRTYHTQRGGPPRVGVSTHELEEISFTFQKIEITNVSGGVTASDDWLAA
jgi:type VI secretion system secreted protein Hcp